MTAVPLHPAKFSDSILDVIATELAALISPGDLVWDPFAGVGLVHKLKKYRTVGTEIEPEWAACDKRTIVANALVSPFRDETFDAVVTSPCMEQGHRVLTDDLRWKPVGDVVVGDVLLAFDEVGKTNGRGMGARRRWRRSEVIRSVPRTVECVRVILENGDEIVTTPEHPWLADRYAYRNASAEWVSSRDLAGITPMPRITHRGVCKEDGCSDGVVARGWCSAHYQRWRMGAEMGRRMRRPGSRQPFYVQRHLEPWVQRTSFDAGWLSGIFDGEGSLSLGVHGAPKMIVTQTEGRVLERSEELMTKFGYSPSLYWKTKTEERHKKCGSIFVGGGFPGIITALGELRPTRLLDKWQSLDISTRTIEADRVAVLAVEPAGKRDIQEIETTEGTYFGEGYLMHNCYGNRMADHHNAKDGTRRITYRHMLGRPLHAANSGQIQWGETYRTFHVVAWCEVWRTLKEGAPFVLDISDHIRAGQVMPVVDWHIEACEKIGFKLVNHQKVVTPRMRYGENHKVRVDHEVVATFLKLPKT